MTKFNPNLHKVPTCSPVVNIAGVGGIDFSTITETWGPPKCHARGERVMMHDGHTKAAEDVVVGDLLMGPDSKPRRVLETHSGIDELYRVTPRRKGRGDLVVNQHHMLRLRVTANIKKAGARVNTMDEISMSVANFARSAKSFRQHSSLYKVGVEYPLTSQSLPVPPYLLGVLLGDGSMFGTSISVYTADPEVKAYVEDYCATHGLRMAVYDSSGCEKLKIATTKGDDNYRDNPLLASLRELGVYGKNCSTKFIPDTYLFASRADRLSLLAGLVDTDGHYDAKRQGFEIFSKSEKMALATVQLARSLGMDSRTTPKRIDSQHVTGSMGWRTVIYGELGAVPTLIARKKARSSTRNRAVLHFGIRDVEPLGPGEFFGFTVDCDNLYLDEHFYVVANSGKSTFLYQTAGEHFLPHYGDDAILLILDSENSANNIRLKHVFGIRIGNLPDMYPDGDPRVFLEPAFTIEQGVEHIMRYAVKAKEEGKFLMVIWDSITTSKPRREYDYINGVLEKDAVDTSDGDKRKDAFGTNMSLNQLRPQIIKWGLNQVLGSIYMAPVAVFLVNQATTKITQVGGSSVASESSGGGYAFKHNIHYSLYFRFIKKIGDNPVYFTGTLTKLKIDKSKVIPSLHDIDMHITDEAGGKFMPGMEVVEFAKQLGFIGEKNGGWHWVKDEFLPPDAGPELKKNYQKKDLALNLQLLEGLKAMIEIYLRKQFQLLEWAYLERDLAITAQTNDIKAIKGSKK
jgi:hypothetical protein